MSSSPASSPAAAGPPPLDPGNAAWVLVSTALVLLMIPGVGFLYSGLSKHTSAISLIFLSFLSVGVVTFQWFFWGYSLAFGDGGPFIGNLYNFAFINVDVVPNLVAPTIPANVYAIFQGMFAAITPALAFGAGAERLKILPAIVFIFVWSTLVYDPIAYWTWSYNGWLRVWGVLDFAGGGPVHMASGFGALAYALVLGKRQDRAETVPHNIPNILIGTTFLWVGWLGFNGGSALDSTARAANAILVSMIASSVGGLTWMTLSFYSTRKWSCVSYCLGVVAGLVAITPAAGYVAPWASMIFGLVAAIVCKSAVGLKHYMPIDDALDVWAIHGVGGAVGSLLTGIFAQGFIGSFDASAFSGGFMDGNYMLLAKQLSAVLVISTWAFVVTLAILLAMKAIPFLNPRMTEEAERLGSDESELGENAYSFMMGLELRRPSTTATLTGSGRPSTEVKKVSGETMV